MKGSLGTAVFRGRCLLGQLLLGHSRWVYFSCCDVILYWLLFSTSLTEFMWVTRSTCQTQIPPPQLLQSIKDSHNPGTYSSVSTPSSNIPYEEEVCSMITFRQSEPLSQSQDRFWAVVALQTSNRSHLSPIRNLFAQWLLPRGWNPNLSHKYQQHSLLGSSTEQYSLMTTHKHANSWFKRISYIFRNFYRLSILLNNDPARKWILK